MGWQNNIYAWLILCTAVATSLMAVLAYRRSRVPGARSLIWLMVGVTVWAVGYTLELSMTDLHWQIFWAKAEYLGILSVPVLWFILTLQYTRRAELLTRRNLLFLAIEPVLALILVWTNESHRLVWLQWQQDKTPVGVILTLTHGPVFYLIVAYAYLLLLVGAVLLVVAFARANALYQRQSVIMLIGAAVPWIGNAMYISGFTPFPDLDPTPFAFAITGIAFSWGLFRYRLLDIVPVARSLIIESMRDAVMVFDINDRLLDLNVSAQQLIEGAHIAAPPPVGIKTAPGSKAVLKSGARQRGGTVLIGKPGLEVIPFWKQIEGCVHDTGECGDLILASQGLPGIFEAFKTTIFDHQHKKDGTLLVIRDVSRNRRVESDLRAARLEADAANLAKSVFLTNMSHELHRPLNVITKNVMLLLEAYRLADSAGDRSAMSVEQLSNIYIAGEQLQTLLTDILDYTHLDSGEIKFSLETFDVRQMILETAGRVQTLMAQNGNRLEIEAVSVGSMYADRSKVQQILTNLLDNAARFTQNGLVELKVARQAVRGSERLVFCVQDSGIGIPSERIQDIFKPFVQLSNSAERKNGGADNEGSAGLGLAVTQRLCQLLGGEISAESTPGKGSLFCFWLPAKHSPARSDALLSDAQ